MLVFVDILSQAAVIALVSLLVKFILKKYKISYYIQEKYDLYKLKWMPERCNYCFNAELCVVVFFIGNFNWLALICSIPLCRYFEKD